MTALKKEEEGVEGKICEECGNLNVKGRFTCAACGAKLTGGKEKGNVEKVKDDSAGTKDKHDDRKAKGVERKAEVEHKKEKAEAAKSRARRVKRGGVQPRHNVRFKKQVILVASCSCGWTRNFGPDKTATELAEAIETHKK